MSGIKINFSSGMFMVPDSFVDRFIKDTNASYIKLYIYILRHVNNGKSLNVDIISEETGLLKSDVVSALKYWSKCGVLEYGNEEGEGYINVLNIGSPGQTPTAEPAVNSAEIRKEETPKKEIKVRKTSAASAYNGADVVKAVTSDYELKHMFSLIQQMLNKNLSTNDYKIIYSFKDYLKLSEEVILILFEYCISIGKTSMRYIETVAYSWADNGITTVDAAEKYIQDNTEKNTLLKKYKRKFKIVGRDFTDEEAKYIFEWVYKLKAPEELIMSALGKSVINTGKIAMTYMHAIIKDELSSGPDSTEKSPNVRKSNFRNYPDSYEISDEEKKMIDKMMAEYKGENSDAGNE